jgi:phosphoserine phosphatase RsbU/P
MSEKKELEAYISGVIHEWSRTLTLLGITLIPLFFILDVFMMPRELLPRFGVYRLVTVVIVIGQHAVLRASKPNRRSFLHGYFFSIVVGLMIALMTTDLGGFDSTYYAGLNLVLIAVNLLLPWAAIHSAVNSALIIGLYVGLNLLVPQQQPVHREILINNIYFLASTAVIAVSINHVKQRLITQEFRLRADLKAARDALWGEMEVAKRIQTSLLPKTHEVNGYRVAAVMNPAAEVGGDYYDVIETPRGETWLCIGDVSGHGVESGLIMMMAQTSLFSTISGTPGLLPSRVLGTVNEVLKKNITRLGTDRYMTCMAIRLEKDAIAFAGKHQDILIWRARTGTTEQVETEGVWLGLVDDIDKLLPDERRPIEPDDVILLFTDGVTEAMNGEREQYGEERLRQALARSARLDPEKIVEAVVKDVTSFTHQQRDDLTVVAIKRSSQHSLALAS